MTEKLVDLVNWLHFGPWDKARRVSLGDGEALLLARGKSRRAVRLADFEAAAPYVHWAGGGSDRRGRNAAAGGAR